MRTIRRSNRDENRPISSKQNALVLTIRYPAIGCDGFRVSATHSTLFRSRQHRVILSFHLGIVLGLPTFFSTAAVLRSQTSTGNVWHEVDSLLLIPSVLLICCAVAGVSECLAESRRALYGWRCYRSGWL